MKKLTIQGTCTGVNNMAIIDVFSSNATNKPYDVRKVFYKSFIFELDDLEPGTSYIVDVTGFTFGTFEVSIIGEITKPVQAAFSNTDFSPGYIIKTKK
ncbi:hypothetical protein J2787_002488 [Chryseobacterium rhizosphaerae]|uniref:Uncharacterized protein n=1 Tax=Chryseobacterium rhizosphaerae TaxID=395937 RepID=A0AAE3YBJ2_9FLAO|nr:hypothetical protein [Chryseobacterium rhizosphaerae]MDR6527108.1 hypothetical protein [Chryseobacterium rhizosphaerae]